MHTSLKIKQPSKTNRHQFILVTLRELYQHHQHHSIQVTAKQTRTSKRPRIPQLPRPLRKELLAPRTRRKRHFRSRRDTRTPAPAGRRQVHGDFSYTAAVAGVVEDRFVSMLVSMTIKYSRWIGYGRDIALISAMLAFDVGWGSWIVRLIKNTLVLILLWVRTGLPVYSLRLIHGERLLAFPAEEAKWPAVKSNQAFFHSIAFGYQSAIVSTLSSPSITR